MSCLIKDMSTFISSILVVGVDWHIDKASRTFAVSAAACSVGEFVGEAAESPSCSSWSRSCLRYLSRDEEAVLFLFGGDMMIRV